MSLFWRVFAINAVVICATAIVLAATPGYIHFPNSLLEGALGLIALGVVLGVNLVLLRPAFEPLLRLTRLMRRVDLFRPGQRLEVSGRGEVAVLGATFNEMLERLEAQQRASMTATLTAQEEERRRIARNLHDEIGQTLTAALLRLDRLRKRLDPELQVEFDEAVEAVRIGLDDVRRVARELRPGVLEDLGLANALRELCMNVSEGSGVLVDRLITPTLPDLSPETELVIYRVAQESLTNAVRHADATRIELRLERVPGGVVLRVSDNGKGFAGGGPPPSLGGLHGMREWALLVGGELDVSARRPTGVQIRLRVDALEEERVA